MAWPTLALCVLAIAIVACGPFAVAAQGSATAGTPSAATGVPTPPPISAAAAFAVDVSAGTVLYALNADERREPASLTKMATSLVVDDALNQKTISLEDRVTIVGSDVVNPDLLSHMGLAAGDIVTVQQLLDGLLIPSGSDAALALARFVGGKLPGGDPVEGGDPVATFVKAMNARVAALGLRDTHFVNPEGDDAPDQYSSARDLARLAAEVLASPTLATIVQTPEIAITSVGPEAHDYGVLKNTNELLGRDGIDGVKTGTTDEAGACLVAATHFAGNRVITVVLGSAPDPTDQSDPMTWPRFADTETILSGLDHQYHWMQPAELNQIPGLAAELAAWQVAFKEGPAVVVPEADVAKLSYRLRLGKEGKPDAQVGRVLFFAGAAMVGERPVYQTPITADAAVQGAGGEATTTVFGQP